VNQNTSELDELPDELALAFAPLHKRAFGMAVGVTLGSVVFLATIFGLIVSADPPLLHLLSNFFPGYTVSFSGAFIGFGWAAFSFFVAGWFSAFCRNLVLAATIWMERAKAELHATRDFLDHI
jgi:hypothetical protein